MCLFSGSIRLEIEAALDYLIAQPLACVYTKFLLDMAGNAAHTNTPNHPLLPNQNEPRRLSKFVYGQSDKCSRSRDYGQFILFDSVSFEFYMYIISSVGVCLLYTYISSTSSGARRKKE